MYTVYVLLNPRDQKVKYVGMTKNSLLLRLRQHLQPEGANLSKKEWIESLITIGLCPVIKGVFSCSSREIAQEEERFVIKTLRTQGAEILNGGPHSVETRMRQSFAKKGRPSSHRGKTWSEQGRRNTSESVRGKRKSFRTDEHRRRLSESSKLAHARKRMATE